MTREKTDSITHLVKIVAGEVFDRKIKEYDHKGATEETVIRNMLGNITSSLKEAGLTWLPREDALLIDEVRIAVAQIAKNHSRSIVAIESRIRHKDIM